MSCFVQEIVPKRELSLSARPADVQQDAADERYSGGEEPFSAPDLDCLPVGECAGRVHEAGDDRCGYAHESGDEADHSADAQSETAAKMVKIQGVPLARRRRSCTGVPSAAAHAAERGIDNELRAAVLAEVMSHRLLGEGRSDIHSRALAAGRRCFFPMFVVKHGLPVTAFSS